MKNRIVHQGIIAIFCSLYFLVATISMINSVAFFDLAHTGLMNWALAIGFELGAAASLAAIIILDKTNKAMVWGLFLLLTAFQMMANSYHAFVNLEDFQGWIELFGLQDEELLFQKRVLSIVSGAVLPVVALGFIKSLTDYLKPDSKESKIDDYYEDRNKHMVDVVEKRRRAENFEKAEKEVQLEKDEKNGWDGEEEYDGIDAVDEIQKEFEKQATPFDPTKNVETDPEPISDELDVHVDEETGTTYIKTKPATNSGTTKTNPL